MSESSVWQREMTALLVAEGYAVHIDERGQADLDAWPLDIAVVDLAISRCSGAAVLQMLRARTSVPILAVSPEVYPEPAVLEAYAAGADQFVTRGIRSRELVARIRALLRRSPQRTDGGRALEASGPGVSLDLTARVATVVGVSVPLTQRECQVLHALLQRPGSVVTREQLGGTSWSGGVDSAVDSAVRSVRVKLEAVEGRRRIVAVRAVGFRLLQDSDLRLRSLDTTGAAAPAAVSLGW